MLSPAVSFSLEFPARRQLQSSTQSSAVDPLLSPAFQQRVRAQVAASLSPAIPERNVLIATTSEPRVLEVTIIGLADDRGITSAQVVADVASSSFITTISNGLGTTVNMKVAPVAIVRTTPVPSPPPVAPPTPPVSPPSVPLGADGLALDTGNAASSASREMWMIIAAVVGLLIAFGCLVAYCLGKRSAARKKTRTVQVGRPALRRQISPEEARERAAAAGASAELPSPSGDDAVTGMPVEDVRLFELGMAVERTMELARQQSGESSRGEKHGAKLEGLAASDIALRLDGVQAAIDDVRESLSPRSPRAGLSPTNVSPHPRVLERRASMPRSPRTEPVDTRINVVREDLGV